MHMLDLTAREDDIEAWIARCYPKPAIFVSDISSCWVAQARGIENILRCGVIAFVNFKYL